MIGRLIDRQMLRHFIPPLGRNKTSLRWKHLHFNNFEREMSKFKEPQHKPFIKSLVSWTFFPSPLCRQMSEDIMHIHTSTCLTLCGHWAQANYWSCWVLIQLLPSSFITAASSQKIMGCLEGVTSGKEVRSSPIKCPLWWWPPAELRSTGGWSDMVVCWLTAHTILTPALQCLKIHV